MKIKFKYNGILTNGLGNEPEGIPPLQDVKVYKSLGRSMVHGTMELKKGDVIEWIDTHSKITVFESGFYALIFEETKDE